MAKTNRDFMQIPKEYLDEKNYTGTRIIEINDETVAKLHQEKLVIMENEKKPLLDQMSEQEVPLEKFYEQIRPLESQLIPLKEEMRPLVEAYKLKIEEVEKVQQKIDLVESKINKIVNDLVKPELGEFEKAIELKIVDNKYLVEVRDEIEEKVKEIRKAK